MKSKVDAEQNPSSERIESERQSTGLKRCPFCGAIPKLIEQPTEVHFYVMCIECGACGSDLHGRQDAITAWNTRAIPPDSEDVGDLVSRSAVVERLREVIADAQDKLGLVPGNMAFEKGRLEAAKSLMKEFEASLADEDLELK